MTRTRTRNGRSPTKGMLEAGSAWVQLCVTRGERTLILSTSGWVAVR